MEEIFPDQAEISKYRRKFLYSNVLNSSLYILENAEVYKAFHMKYLRVIQVANQVQFEKNKYISLPSSFYSVLLRADTSYFCSRVYKLQSLHLKSVTLLFTKPSMHTSWKISHCEPKTYLLFLKWNEVSWPFILSIKMIFHNWAIIVTVSKYQKADKRMLGNW